MCHCHQNQILDNIQETQTKSKMVLSLKNVWWQNIGRWYGVIILYIQIHLNIFTFLFVIANGMHYGFFHWTLIAHFIILHYFKVMLSLNDNDVEGTCILWTIRTVKQCYETKNCLTRKLSQFPYFDGRVQQ